MEREALKLALEAAEIGLANLTSYQSAPIGPSIHEYGQAVRALIEVREAKKALAQPAQEPVAWRWGIKKLNGGYEWRYALHKTQEDAIPLYAAPPQREWVGLTDKDKQKLAAAQFGWEDLLIAAEAKLKEKNNGT